MGFWKALFDGILHRARDEQEMADELRFHMESRAEHLQRMGVPTEEAKRRARLEFGGVEGYKERCRDARGWRMFDDLASDISYALRTLRKIPGFSVTAVLSLALSIGVNLSCFASLYAMVLHPFAFDHLERIVTVSDVRGNSGDRNLVAPANYLDWKQRSHTLEQLAAFREWDANLSGVDHPDHVRATVATSELFSILGIHPQMGRSFSAEECRAGRDAVAVLSRGFWQTKFAAAPDAVGKTMLLDGRRYTVIGVMPDEFGLPLQAELWTPLTFGQQEHTDRETQDLSVLGKLRPGATVRQAAAELGGIALQLASEYPKTNASHGISITTLTDGMTSENGHFIGVLMCAALFVLLLGAINVGGLQVARAMSRQKEMGLRSALGANGWRIFRQLLTENLLIALAGGSVGLALAAWHLNIIRANIPPAIYQVAAGLKDMRINGWVAWYGVALSVVVGMLCCLPAAFEATRASRSGDLNEVLREGGRSSRTSSLRRRLRTILVAGEVALAFVLLIGAALMVTTLRRISTVDLGYDQANLLTARVSLSGNEYRKPSRIADFYRGVLMNVGNNPGVEAIAIAGDEGPVNSVFIEGRDEAHPGELRPNLHAASSQYLRATKLPLRNGRWISEQDDASARGVVVLSASVARHYWPESNPIGKRVRLGSGESPWLTVIGVTGDVNDWFLGRPQPAAYVSYKQFPSASMQFLLRGRNDSRNLAGGLRSAAREQDKEQPVYDAHTMEQQMHEETTGIRNAADMMGTYAAIALLLAVTGIYSMSSFFVAQRKPDIAVRMSLGATRKSIVWMVLGQSCRLTAAGLAVGVPVAILLSLGMSRVLYGIVTVQAGVFLTYLAILSGSAILAGYLPAYRASRVDPVTILRQE